MSANQKCSHLDAELRAGYRTNPIGLPTARGVMLSWAVSDRVVLDRSAGYTVRVARRGGGGARKKNPPGGGQPPGETPCRGGDPKGPPGHGVAGQCRRSLR